MKKIIGYGVTIGNNNGHCFYLYNRDKKELYPTDQLDSFNVIATEDEAKKIAEKETSQPYSLVRFVGTDERDYTVEDVKG